MSRHDLLVGLDIISRHPDWSYFVGPRDVNLVIAAELTLNLKLPLLYREFVERLGAGSFGALEIYGLIESNFHNSRVPDAVWATLKQRQQFRLLSKYIVIGIGQDDEYLVCVDCGENNNGAIVGVPLGKEDCDGHAVCLCSDFGGYFREKIEFELNDLKFGPN